MTDIVTVVYLIRDIDAAKVKINGLFGFLCVDLADGHHPAFLQEQGQWVAVARVTHTQGRADSCT